MKAVALLILAMAACGCEREAASPVTGEPAGGEAPRSVIETESDLIRDLRQQAAAGDPIAMLTLGQAYQTQGATAEARQWFEKARAAGSTQAEQALAALDETDALDRAAATQPLDVDSLNAPSSTRPAAATTQSAAPRAPRDPSKVSWDEILGSYDAEKFKTETRSDANGRFVALSRSDDETMIIAATGPAADAIKGVQIIVRIRNRQNAGENLRVRQAGAVCATVTRDNVRRSEVADWVKSYLASEQAPPPIYRGGWQILVTGPRAEGKADGKSAIGAAVKIDLSR